MIRGTTARRSTWWEDQIAHGDVERIRRQRRRDQIALEEVDPLGDAVERGPLPRHVEQLG
jgi:hypothetical protein